MFCIFHPWHLSGIFRSCIFWSCLFVVCMHCYTPVYIAVYRRLHGTAPEYLSELLVPASTRSSRHCLTLKSSNSNKLIVPPVKLSTYGRRAFTVTGPVVWNSLPEYLRDPTLSIDSFRRSLKSYFFCLLLIYSRRLMNSRLHALLWLIVITSNHCAQRLRYALSLLLHCETKNCILFIFALTFSNRIDCILIVFLAHRHWSKFPTELPTSPVGCFYSPLWNVICHSVNKMLFC